MFLIAVMSGSFTLFFTGKGWSTILSDARMYASEATAVKAKADVKSKDLFINAKDAYIASVAVKV
jgi:hypothetical protein